MGNTAKRTYTGLPVCKVIEKVAGVNNAVTVIKSAEWQQYNHYPLKAVWPVLDKPALSLCRQRYRAYEEHYNQRVDEANHFIGKYNNSVSAEIEKSEAPKAYWLASQNFLEANSAMDVWRYNNLARHENEKKGMKVYQLRKVQPLKNEHRLFFDLVLRKYATDLLKMLPVFRKKGKSEPVTIPKVDINSCHLQNLTHVGGSRMTNQSRATLRRHKKRLEEAGVLQDRSSRGHKRGVNYFVNPEIMAISDDFSKKTMVSDNQPLKMLNSTKCTDIYTLTRAITQNNLNAVDKSTSDITKKSVGESENPDDSAGFLPVMRPPSEDFTRAPMGRKQKKSAGGEKFPAAKKNGARSPGENPENGTASRKAGVDRPSPQSGMAAGTTEKGGASMNATAADNLRNTGVAGNIPLHRGVQENPGQGTTPAKGDGTTISARNSDELRESLLPSWDFSVKLADGKCSEADITPLNKLVLESNSGNLDHFEYVDLILQNLFVYFARLYRFKTGYRLYHKLVFKLYEDWAKSYFFYNRNGHSLDKSTILERYRKLVFTMTSKRHGAQQRIDRGMFDPPHIEVYLNPHAATPGTLLHHYKKIEKKAPTLDHEIAQFGKGLRKIAERSKVYSLHKHRLFRKFSQHAKGHIDDMQLFQYANDNLPSELKRDFDLHWTVFINNKNQK
ncbi:hypothetical protein [Flagellimonas marina]|uniref:Uncharacterized protein n=1 Tax=Flagellimonas marina TaxID=1775168 RepID=A0ABV8PII6_9FLAO